MTRGICQGPYFVLKCKLWSRPRTYLVFYLNFFQFALPGGRTAFHSNPASVLESGTEQGIREPARDALGRPRMSQGPNLGRPRMLHLLFHAQNLPKWEAKPPIFDFSGHEIKGRSMA